MNKNPDNWFENSCTLHIKSIRLYNHSMQYILAYLTIYMYSIADYSMHAGVLALIISNVLALKTLELGLTYYSRL